MRILILSDIHANFLALQSALDSVDYDKLWVLGDLVGYGADPNSVVEEVRRLEPELIVRGNHDKVCCGLEEPENFSDLARESALWTRKVLSRDSNDYLRGLPQGPLRQGSWLISHGSPMDEDEYLICDDQVFGQMAEIDAPVCFFGHTHVPLVYRNSHGRRDSFHIAESADVPLDRDCRYFINPGSVGQPRDRDARGCFALLDIEGASLRFVKFKYPLADAAQRILAAGLPELLAQRLFIGW